ncbi:MAG: BglII/BstYI family type II restriction endonuclease [Thermoplasmatales archaeon]|nr:BglII/BstYI family type II restriction endonuclease [Thermoplasmatales archaeon]
MRVVEEFDHKGGKAFISGKFPKELEEIYEVISRVDLSKYRTKVSKEKTMLGQMLYSPIELNKAFKKEFESFSWSSYKQNRINLPFGNGAFREMDFIKSRLGVEVQFGKYAFMAYNVSAKMTIFHNKGFIDAGVEIVPVKKMAEQMSTGVSYFEQIKWDLEARGVADIDIPVIIMGIDG